MLSQDFYSTLDSWTEALDKYSFELLCKKPSLQSWSLGQLYMHLYNESSYYLKQARICLCSDKNQNWEMTPAGKIMFANNTFPDELIEGPPENALVAQPNYKEELKEKFLHLRQEMQAVENLFGSSTQMGKTKHPGLGYFSATEWVQFADMHLRHHLRQKARIDEFLNFSMVNSSIP
jgi:hypothetical protein